MVITDDRPMETVSRRPRWSQHASRLTSLGRFIKTVLGWLVGARRWRGIFAMTALLSGVSFLAVLLGIMLTPNQSVDALGQHFTIGAAPPQWALRGHGEITVNTGHPQTFDVLPTRYYGLLRAHLSVDAPFQGSEVLNKAAIEHKFPPEAADQFERGFRTWLVHFAEISIGVGMGLGAIIALIFVLVTSKKRDACLLVVRCIVAASLAMVLSATLFIAGSSGIAHADSFDALVGHSTLHLSPKPVVPDLAKDDKLSNYSAVSIGDSRAATQGTKNIVNPTSEQVACQRSSDSLAAQIGRLLDWRVLNQACSAATIAEGLMGQQCRGEDPQSHQCTRWIVAQMSVVKKMTNLRAVFVTIGPNDLWWARGIGLCYMADVCNDNLTVPNYQSLMERFKWNYHDLLVALQELRNGPGGTHPMIIINGSYDVLDENATCDDAKGLTREKIGLLNQRNAELNKALQDGAQLFGFRFVKPPLKKLCEDLADSPGPDLRGRTEHDAFHPTGNGVMVMAAADVTAYYRAA
jgi:lysophospholipase L1-like esterase